MPGNLLNKIVPTHFSETRTSSSRMASLGILEDDFTNGEKDFPRGCYFCLIAFGRGTNNFSASFLASKTERNMALRLGDTAPNFTAQTTEGEVDFHEWLGESWGLLFSHPADYTP